MKRCTVCVMPDSRPDTEFVDGVCSACISYQKRPTIDWGARKADLTRLLEQRYQAGAEFDLIVPSSGGKDSTYQVLTLLELGARPLVVTASTCMLTPVGRKNIDNLKSYATTIEVSPNTEVRRKLNRIGLEMVGDISHPEHMAIFTTPFRVALAMGIPLIFYGECPQREYGGPLGSEEARTMTQRWVSEFGGFLGLRASDCVGQYGITAKDMLDYTAPDAYLLQKAGIEAHFLGQYIEWDSERNAKVAIEHGMKVYGVNAKAMCEANWWPAENLDNAMTGLHDHGGYRKYGYGRGCAQISVDVRRGFVDRDFALDWVLCNDGAFPWQYCGVGHMEVVKHLGITDAELVKHLDEFTNWELFDGVNDRRPILKEFA